MSADVNYHGVRAVNDVRVEAAMGRPYFTMRLVDNDNTGAPGEQLTVFLNDADAAESVGAALILLGRSLIACAKPVMAEEVK